MNKITERQVSQRYAARSRFNLYAHKPQQYKGYRIEQRGARAFDIFKVGDKLNARLVTTSSRTKAVAWVDVELIANGLA